MKLEKITENQTRNTYEIQMALIDDSGMIYGNINGSILQSPFSGDLVRVRLYIFGRLTEDTLEKNDITLSDLISEVLKNNNIEIDNE